MARAPIHPGEILADELQEIGVTPTELSRQIDVPANRIAQIIHGRRGVTGDTALRRWATGSVKAQFWLNRVPITSESPRKRPVEKSHGCRCAPTSKARRADRLWLCMAPSAPLPGHIATRDSRALRTGHRRPNRQQTLSISK